MRIDNLTVSSGESTFPLMTYVQAQNGSQQSIPFNTITSITNWTNVTTQNAAEWNASTGVFTATKVGIYLVSSFLTYANASANQGSEWNVTIGKNGTSQITAWNFSNTSAISIIRPTQFANMIITLAVGDTLTIRGFQNLNGSAVALSDRANANILTIQELPSRLFR